MVMAKNPGRLVPLVETFRRILRAQCTRAELADEITGYDWFHRRQYIGSQHNESEYRAAMTSHERVKQGVKEQQIGLRGRLHGNIEEIDPIDATQGEINVFDNTLDTGKKIYTDVHCLESDVTASAGQRPRKKFDRAKKAAESIWGPSGPPGFLANKLICKEVNDRLEKQDIDDATILRAVGRKK
jgi:hypothetical protein